MDTSALLLGLRVVLSLACVFGLLWYAGRRMSGSGVVRKQRAAAMAVVGRQSLGGKTGIALVEVGGRRLLLGVSEHGVNLLTEVELPEPEPVPARTDRVELDPALLESALLELPADDDAVLDDAVLDDALLDDALLGGARPEPAAADAVPALAAVVADNPARPVRAPRSLSTPAARKPAVPKPRNPLEGSILDAATWRQAVVAVQERTLRH